MKQQERIYRIVCWNPGITATGVSHKLKTLPMSKGGPNRCYLSATCLRALHRLVEKGKIEQFKGLGMRKTVEAWRFFKV